ncbi:MAG: MBL fold metallo-hydrolase [Bacteroidetes bacterium]|jgi:glyoxylase-like metal-dependent hydrolase (beta-lactamase superfamily II)|nr:MBL fold metallo-hydrolase [Bacteroidota bacterium]
MTVQSFTFNAFMTNCYVCHDGGEAVLIDPSCATASEQQHVVEYIDEHELTVRHLLLTHAHIDHIFGCAFFSARYGQRFQVHAAERAFIEQAEEQAQAFGVQIDPPPVPDTFLDEGDTVTFGGVTFDILHTPGHSPGSICFVDAASDQAITGDVLFQGSIGRVQGLPQTSRPQLMASITEKLLPLGDETTIYPGHGPSTTIGHERQHNPFLTSDEFRVTKDD